MEKNLGTTANFTLLPIIFHIVNRVLIGCVLYTQPPKCIISTKNYNTQCEQLEHSFHLKFSTETKQFKFEPNYLDST